MILKLKNVQPKQLKKVLPAPPSEHSPSTIPRFILIASSASNLLMLLMLFWLAASVSRLANHHRPTLVQQVGGKAFIAKPVDYSYRDPEILQNVAREWALLNYSFGNLPQIDHQTEQVKYDDKPLPEQTVTASYLLTDELRDSYLKGFAANIYTSEAQRGDLNSLYMPYRVSAPRQIEAGRWQVDVIGSRLITTPNNPSGELIPTNVTLELVAADVPFAAIEDSPSEAAKATYRLLESGIRINNITPLKS